MAAYWSHGCAIGDGGLTVALSLYLGPPGSGKTYEAVSSVMLPAYLAGRHIVTNIKGVDPRVWEESVAVPETETRGTITVVDENFFTEELNYPLMTKAGVNLEPGAIPAGALVVIDEAYTVFPTGAGNGVTPRMIEYVRTHRHFVSSDGVASDLVLISQDVMSIHPRIRSVAEFCCAIRNMRHMKMAKRYRVDAYANWKMTKSSMIGSSQRKYKEFVFTLYKSFEADGAAKVVMTDKSFVAIKWYHWAFLVVLMGVVAYAIPRAFGAKEALSLSATPKTSPLPVSRVRKPDCSGSGVLVDVGARKVFKDGRWSPVNEMFTGEDGHVRWDVGDCVFRFGT